MEFIEQLRAYLNEQSAPIELLDGLGSYTQALDGERLTHQDDLTALQEVNENLQAENDRLVKENYYLYQRVTSVGDEDNEDKDSVDEDGEDETPMTLEDITNKESE